MKTYYSVASMDAHHRFMTRVCQVLVFGFVVETIILLFFKRDWPGPGSPWFSIPFALAALAWLSAFWRPTGYEIDDDSVLIASRTRRIEIPLSEVKDVCRIHEAKFVPISGKSIGLSPVASVGWYYRRDMGDVYLSMTNESCAVLISSDAKYVISPADPDGFIADLTLRLSRIRQP